MILMLATASIEYENSEQTTGGATLVAPPIISPLCAIAHDLLFPLDDICERVQSRARSLTSLEITMAYDLYRKTNGKYRRAGIDEPELTLVSRNGTGQMVFKCPGRHYFVGLDLPKAYEPAHYIVLNVEDAVYAKGEFVEGKATHVISFPVRQSFLK